MENSKEIFNSFYNDVIAKNQQSMYTWSKYKEDLTTAGNLINTLSDKVSHHVMVPLGPKAMMPGKIVHTNEFLVSLGANYFSKQSAKQTREFCDRKVKTCNEMLHNLEEELKLYTNKSSFPVTNDVFGNADRPEIIEHVTTEEDEKWREEHRKKEKEYRLQLAETRMEERKKIETEEDIFERLDQLELEEELEDELNRLHEGEDNSDSDDENEDNGSTNSVSENDLKNSAAPEKSDATEADTVTSPKRKRSVIFVEENNESCDEPVYLRFKHSSFIPEKVEDSKVLNSPSDIYLAHVGNVKNCSPVSILKVKSNPNQQREVLAASSLSDEDEPTHVPQVLSSGFEIPEVVEKIHSVVTNVPVGSRPVSKFKASRMKK